MGHRLHTSVTTVARVRGVLMPGAKLMAGNTWFVVPKMIDTLGHSTMI
jgi:hypothetical protein